MNNSERERHSTRCSRYQLSRERNVDIVSLKHTFPNHFNMTECVKAHLQIFFWGRTPSPPLSGEWVKERRTGGSGEGEMKREGIEGNGKKGKGYERGGWGGRRFPKQKITTIPLIPNLQLTIASFHLQSIFATISTGDFQSCESLCYDGSHRDHTISSPDVLRSVSKVSNILQCRLYVTGASVVRF